MCLGDGCGCDKYCSRVWGCPGNAWDFRNNKAQIDPVTCVGCGVCAKLCPSGAIRVEEESEERNRCVPAGADLTTKGGEEA